jgi:hypothetical protein
MFIVLQEVGDTMVLDSLRGHQTTYERLAAFLSSPQVSIEFEAGPRCPAIPDATTLGRFRMVKTSGPILTHHLPDASLQVSGRPELLARYAETFKFEAADGGEHRHPEQQFADEELDPASEMIIVQAEDALDDPEAWRDVRILGGPGGPDRE